MRIGTLECAILAPLGHGSHCDVFLAQRINALPQRLILKLARAGSGPALAASQQRLQQEADNLDALQALQVPGANWHTRLLQQTVCLGIPQASWHPGRAALLLRNGAGWWGSLADVHAAYAQGIPGPHLIWIARRMLEWLRWLHEAGVAHGAIRAAHWLLNPRDHTLQPIAWGSAQLQASAAQKQHDLQQAAQLLLEISSGTHGSSTLPGPIVQLLQRAQQDAGWCAGQGAHGLHQQLTQLARASYGPARYLHFDPSGGQPALQHKE